MYYYLGLSGSTNNFGFWRNQYVKSYSTLMLFIPYETLKYIVQTLIFPFYQ